MGVASFLVKVFASFIAVPGCLHLVVLAGFTEFPPEMRMPEKLGVIGVVEGDNYYVALMIAIGLLKLSVPANIWLIKSKTISMLQLLIALPGFALVEYAHRQLTDPPMPLHEDIPVFVIPTLLAILALSPASTKK
eukprot:CAMPEP_0119490118 /NCGR_PEP_ID=MMETSP1344-20130328/15377_1 /TAXON_ID=236787 /ORGANISM="Florenciella parvula, Strain CCMP2471" /LENGTH=134 /DNA_ID=CAMNT_0007525229 /DNA_START=48 /DNA_END=449 /DNA_ORIENTATION=+